MYRTAHIYLIAVCLLLTGALPGFAQTAIYVSLQGNDTNAGTLQKPVATLAAAQRLVQKRKGPVTVFIRGGTYYLQRAIRFTVADSRSATSAVAYRAYRQEQVRISGARLLKLTWKPYRDGIYQAGVPAGIIIDQLFVNGQLQHMARYPDFDSTAAVMNGTAADAASAERATRWKHPDGGFIHALHKSEWGGLAYRITGKDAQGAPILVGGWQNNRASAMHPTYRFAENIFEELDAPGEWYFNGTTRILYHYPKKGTTLSRAIIEAPQLTQLFVFKGSAQKPVSYITLAGLQLCHTLRTFMETKEPLLRSDWTIYRGGMLLLDGTSNCSIRNCTLEDGGGNGIFLSNYNRKDTVSGCHLNQLGASGICFVGDPGAVRSPSFEYRQFVPLAAMDRTPGPKTDNYPARCLAVDNLIHHIGLVEKQVAGVQLSMSQDITLNHNTICNVPRAGINVNEGTWGGHIIEYNDVFNTVLETGDHGAFNSWGRDRFWHAVRDSMVELAAAHPELILLDAVKTTIIRNNRFRCDRGWDIDLDDGSSNYHIYNNVLLNGGLKFREGFDRVAENNVIVNNTFHPHVWFANSGDVFTRNVVATAYLPIRVTKWGKLVDRNIFLDSSALVHEQQAGHDQNSVFTAVKFRNAVTGDYHLPETPAVLGTGFRNFDMEHFGVMSAHLQQLAEKVEIPQAIRFAAKPNEQVAFMGLMVKSLTTLAERSATGMNTEKGVLVLEVSPTSQLSGLIRPNDVLLAFNGKEVADVSALLQAKLALRAKSLVIKVFRDQREQEVKVVSNKF